MIPSSRHDELQQTKKEESVPNGTFKLGNTKTVWSSSRQWPAFRNPRIVRVSRTFGGKDRHSKVYTVRGLRDRRIRLSVPTAIQLYDLQERLGLSQPSKVIDWLMDSTKDDIDMLPPLQLPQGSFGQFLQKSIMGGGVASSYNDHIAEQNYNPPLQDVGRANELNQVDNVSWMEMNNQHGLNHFQGLRGYNNNQVAAQNFFPVVSEHSTYKLYNHNWDQLENHRSTSSTMHQPSNNNHVNSSSLWTASSSSTFEALNPSGGQQLFFCPPPTTSTFFPATTTRYPSYIETAADPRQINSNFHNLFSPSSIKTFQLNNANPNKIILQHSQGENNSSS